MAKCRNPECVNGLTPGVKIIGRGKSGAPLFGQGIKRTDPMQWAWVSCLVCNPKKDDPPFKLIQRTPEEIARRVELANSKAAYKPKSEVGVRLGRVANGAGPALSPPPDNSAANAALMSKMDRLIEGQSELLDQIKELRAENKELKAENARLRSGVNESLASQAKPQ